MLVIVQREWASRMPTSIDERLGALVEAARRNDQQAVNRLLGELEPVLREWTLAACVRSSSLLEAARSDQDEVWSHVFLRLFERPPQNPKDRSPQVAVRAWVKTVALNFLRDRVRRIKREEANALAPPKKVDLPGPRETQAAQLAVMLDADHAEWCAAHRLARRRYLREVFDALRRNVRTTGLELAIEARVITQEELDALPEKERIVKERKLAQHAWKLRERTHRVLMECLRERLLGSGRSRGES